MLTVPEVATAGTRRVPHDRVNLVHHWPLRMWILVCLLLPVSAVANTLKLLPDNNHWRASSSAEYLIDPYGSLDIDIVHSAQFLPQWKPLTHATPNFGFTSDTIWLKLTLENNLSQQEHFMLRLEYPLMDVVDYYAPDAQGHYQAILSGDQLPFSQRLIKERNFTFPLHLLPRQTTTVYLRLQSRDTVIAPLVVYTDAAHANDQRIELLVFGMYYGAIIVILLVNTFLFFFLRQKAQVYFVATLAGYAMMELSLSGIGNVFLWPNQPELAKLIRPVSLGCITIFCLLLTKSYFDLRRILVLGFNIEYLFWLLGLFAITSAFVMPFTWSIRVAMVAIISATSVMAFIVIQQVAQKNQAGSYFLLAWVGMIIGGSLNVLRAFDLVPVNFVTTYGSQIGSLLSLLVLNMGLTQQFRQMQLTRELDNQRRLRQTSEMNRQLDLAVNERTRELEAQTAAAEQARNTAEHAVQAKSQFLATMSHEIRTPMNGVLGITHMLADTPLNQHQRHLVNTIKNSGNALVAIINDILDFSKIEAGKLTLESIPFSLRDLLDESMALFASSTDNKPVRLILHVEPSLPDTIIGDPTRLRQIVMNLVGNAIKFTNSGHIVVRAGYRDIGKHLVISVQDTGIGISQEQQNKLFQSFSQADSSTTRKYGGTGLGLAICRSLVLLMGGTISLESQTSIGSTFTLTLPARIKSRQEIIPALHNKTILICDPLPAFRDALADMVASWGCTPRYPDTDEATLQHIDAAILSQYLPGREMEQWNKRLTCPKLMLRFHNETQTRNDANLTEPVTQEKLRTHLLHLLVGQDRVVTQTEPHRAFDHLRVMVAEDNPVNQMVIRGLLKKFGIVPDIAADGLEAIHYAQTADEPYDMILMDCEMPNLDGYQATRKLRQLPCCATTRIVGLSAHAMPEHREAGLQSGMAAFLTKPVSVEQLEQELAITCTLKPN